MTTDDGKVTADCQFCGAHYEFDPATLGFEAEDAAGMTASDLRARLAAALRARGRSNSSDFDLNADVAAPGGATCARPACWSRSATDAARG